MTGQLLSYLPSASAFLLFAIFHSVFASKRLKSALFERLPLSKVYYRALYNLTSLAFVFAWLWLLPDNWVIYRAPGVLFYFLVTLQLVSFAGLLKSFRDAGGGVFLGFRQIRDYHKNRELPSYLDEPDRGRLVTKGCYRFMRHPTYTFSVFIFLAMPVMTANTLFLLACLMIYFWIGSIHEETLLYQRFGSRYQHYRTKVPKFMPGPAHIYKTLTRSDS